MSADRAHVRHLECQLHAIAHVILNLLNENIAGTYGMTDDVRTIKIMISRTDVRFMWGQI